VAAKMLEDAGKQEASAACCRIAGKAERITPADEPWVAMQQRP